MNRPLLALTLALLFSAPVAAQTRDANRLTYLDAALDPYYVHRDFPKLVTPQWIGDPQVEAVVVLAIDDMRDSARYENYLRPILDRLKKIDGRAPVSIMTNRADPQDPQIARWLKEGVSIEVHTFDHPCPCLQGGDFAAAKQTYEKCVDLMAQIPGNAPVAFRMPCCDSQNTPSPRFWAEIFNRTTDQGNFLTIDSSVFQVFTPRDRELPRELVLDEQQKPRFRRYLPFPSFVNTIDDYPYPYVIGGLCWELPCVVPSDWEAQHVQKPNNPRTVKDMQRALDATVLKQGVFDLVFHPHGWIRNDQIVELIDYAATRYKGRVKFLNFHEVNAALNRHLLAGQPLRAADGGDNGVRLLDVDNDGFMDVVIGNDQRQTTRLWLPKEKAWKETGFPTRFVDGKQTRGSTRFGIFQESGQASLLSAHQRQWQAWHFRQGNWEKADALSRFADDSKLDLPDAIDSGLRLRDLDGDGRCELLVGSATVNGAWRSDAEQGWTRLTFALPGKARFVDAKGRDAGLRFVDFDQDGKSDVLFSNEQHASMHLFRDLKNGWSQQLPQPEGRKRLPMIVRNGTNNGAWLHSRHLWVQNEDTQRLPNFVDRFSLDEALRAVAQLDARDASAAEPFPPPRSLAAALESFEVAAGLEIQLVAAEPLVQDPVAFDWGPDGTLWVVEMGDYPSGDEGGRVKQLVDLDGDGRYDKAHLFLDKVPFPTGIKVWRDGVLIAAAPHILFARDTDGDHKADLREVRYAGFGEGNQQHRVNGMRWGLDGWLYLANGDSGGKITSTKTGRSLSINGRDLRIRPDDGDFQPQSGQTQFGRCRDDWGNWFGGNNSNPLWHYVLADHYLARNPHFAPPSPRNNVSQPPGAAPVFPISRTLARFNDFDKANRFTSACSPTIYRDRYLGEPFAGNAFICEPVHNLVHRQVVRADGFSFVSQRAAEDERAEFLASRDSWFRPVMVRTGPDGALWVADMHRLVIEHPKWIPATWQAKLDLRAGHDRGRIYRVVRKGSPPPKPAPLQTLDERQLVAALDSDNGWQRDMVHQLLLWKNAKGVAGELARQLHDAERPVTRLHALCLLDGLEQLGTPDLLEGLKDEHPAVRRHAVRIAESRLDEPLVLAAVLERVDDNDAQVALQTAYTLGETSDERALKSLALLALRFPQDAYLHAAVLSSVKPATVGPLLGHLLAGSSTRQPPEKLVQQLLAVASADGKGLALNQVLKSLSERKPAAGTPNADEPQDWEFAALAELLERVGSDNAWQKRLEPASARYLDRLLSQAALWVEQKERPIAQRVLAMPLVGRARDASAGNARLLKLVAAEQPPEIQSAAVAQLGRLGAAESAHALLAQWEQHTPRLKESILDVLLARPAWSAALLDAIEQEKLSGRQLSAVRQQQLLRYGDARIAERARKLLGASRPTAARAAVMRQYADAERLQGVAERGRPLFKKHCGNCHRLAGEGTAVGPDLAALTDRTPATLIRAILDPNQAVEEKFLDYLVVTSDGRQTTGMLAEETATSLTLVNQSGKRQVILRNQIEQLKASGKSLMPEGLEKELNPQQLADVIAVLRAAGPPPKPFPGNQPQVAPVRDDGSIRLLAMHAKIYGSTLVFEQKYRNLGFWQSADDRAVWTINPPAEGKYRVVIDYACVDSSAGGSFLLQVDGQRLGKRVPGTGSWDNYRSLEVGTLALRRGSTEVVVVSDGPPRSALFDLRSIRLQPLK